MIESKKNKHSLFFPTSYDFVHICQLLCFFLGHQVRQKEDFYMPMAHQAIPKESPDTIVTNK